MPPGDAKPDWVIIQALAKRVEQKLGIKDSSGFSQKDPSEIWDEMARLVPAFTGISHTRIDEESGVHWPCPGPNHPGTPFLFSESFPRGRGLFHSLAFSSLSEYPDETYPYILSTGRLLYHWHGGTMTRRSVLNDISPEPLMEIHPEDAEKEGVEEGQIVTVSSRRGTIRIKVKVTDKSPRGVLFIPIHFAEASVNELTQDLRDPSAQIPDYKISAVKINI